MKAIVDRIESDIVSIEVEGKIEERKIWEFPDKLKEGDLLIYKDGRWLIDEKGTSKRKEEMDSLLKSLFERDIDG